MTSDTDGTPRRRPPTIDLTAKEIETQAPEQAAGGNGAAGDRGKKEGASKQGPSFAGGLALLAVGAGAGAALVVAIAVGLWLAGAVPRSVAARAANAQGKNGAPASEISAKLDRIEAQFGAQRAVSALAARLATLETQTKSLGDSLGAFDRRLDDVAVAGQTALDRANVASASAKAAGQGDVRRNDLDALTSRIAALEHTAKALASDQARRAFNADDRAARVALAAESLRASVERGAPYEAELNLVKSLGAEATATAPLEPFAAEGIPSAEELAHELSLHVPALAKVSGSAPSNTSFIGHLEDSAKDLVRITPAEAPAGDEVSAVIARMKADAAHGDIAAALAEIAHLPQTARGLVEPWVRKAKVRDAAIAASRRLATDSLARLAHPNTQ